MNDYAFQACIPLTSLGWMHREPKGPLRKGVGDVRKSIQPCSAGRMLQRHCHLLRTTHQAIGDVGAYNTRSPHAAVSHPRGGMHWHRRFSHDELAPPRWYHAPIHWIVMPVCGKEQESARKSGLHSPLILPFPRWYNPDNFDVTSETNSLGGDYSKGRFKQSLGRGNTTRCK